MKSINLFRKYLFRFSSHSTKRYFCTAIETKNVISEEFTEEFSHVPVMSAEVLKAFQPTDNQVFIDMTFGAGGHSQHLMNSADISLYCLDRDPVAYEKCLKFSEKFRGKVTPLNGRFSEIETLLKPIGVQPNSVDGILIDAGCSSMQMDEGRRGFAISKDGPLDMRMDGNRFPGLPTAADVLNTLDVPTLARIFKYYGEEKHAKKIAQALFDARYMLKRINTTYELGNLVKSILGGQRFDKLQRPSHVATKVFQALRIFVNDELNELNYAMEMASNYLKPGGKIVALTFHSLEDRIVKRHILGIDMEEPIIQNLKQKHRNANVWHTAHYLDEMLPKRWTPLYKQIVTPSEEEIHSNPRSRSAKLRAAIKN